MGGLRRSALADLMRELGRRRPKLVSWLLALGAGGAIGVAFPPFGIWPGVFGFGLLLALLDRAAGVRPLWTAFVRGWATGLAFFFVSTWWIGEAFLVDIAAHGWQAPFAVLLLSGGLALLWAAAAMLYRWLAPAGAFRILLFAALFSIAEWLRGHLMSGFPWDLPGEVWRAGSAMSQGAALFGAYGMSFIMLAVGAAPGVLGGLDERRQANTALGVALAVLVALFAYGHVRREDTDAAKPTGLTVRVVQANVGQTAKWSLSSFQDIFGRYLRLTARPPAPGKPVADLVVWSEAAIPLAANDLLAPGSWMRASIVRALRPGQTLLFGAERVDDRDPTAIRYYNSFLALRRTADDVQVLSIYDKHHLVPFGEYLPAEKLMTVIGFKRLAGVGESFTPGAAPRPMLLDGLPAVQPLICYESLFPAFVTSKDPRPAWIVNVSNDAWFGRTTGPWQHLNLASYRAIEEGLPIVRATPTGVSAIVDAKGRTVARLGLARMDVIDAPLPVTVAPPSYTRWRDGPFWLMCLVGLGMALFRRTPLALKLQS